MPVSSIFKRAVGAVAGLTLAVTSLCAAAENYPARPVKIIVPFAPGGTTDIVGRAIAQQLQTRMGQAFVVENRPGAGGNIGAEAVAKSPADGYTLLLVASNVLAINPALYKKTPFDAANAFTPVGNIVTLPNIVVINPENKHQIKTLNDLIAVAKRNPDTLTYGSSGNGSLLHLAGAALVKTTGTTMTHIPYKGAAPMLQALYANEIDFAFDNLPSSISHVTSGRLKAIAITGKQRNGLLPNVPTMTELGFPSLNLTSWFGLVAPAGTSPQIIAALNKQIDAALQDKAVRERFVAMGAQPAPGRPEEFGALIKSEAARWATIVRDSGATVD